MKNLLTTLLLFLTLSLSCQITAQDLSGKTVLITGSTDGLGREVALQMGSRGATVLIHGRNIERAREVVEEIKASGGDAKFYRADFGSLDNVRELAEEVMRDNDQLHILINNAGLGSGFADGERRESQDGYELVLQVNYLAHYLLTDLLLPMIKDSAPARIINISSRAQSPINFGDIMLEDYHSGRATYHRSKLAMVLHALYYAELLEGTGVTFNALHPASMMDTTMVSQIGPARTTVDEGAEVVMYAAISPEVEGVTGTYFEQFVEARADEQAYDPVAREMLDKMSRELVGLPPRE